VADTGYPCDGCSSPTSIRALWLSGYYGMSVVHACSRECAAAAREKRGGGRFLPREPMPPEEREARERYAARVGKREPFGGAS
jgi:hypothetical protein